jgi:stage III sporulation protein AG
LNRYSQFIDYFKKINLDKKTITIIIIGLVLIIILFITELDFSSDESMDENTISDEEYCVYLESKIKTFIEKIEGAGKTEVIITLSETTEYIYATDDKDVRKNNNNSDDSTLEKDYVIIENNNNDVGLLIKTIEPKIRGVAVSCEGGDIISVQEQIYSTIEALLDINTSNISITKLSYTEEENEK